MANVISQIFDNIRDEDVFIIQSTSSPVNDNLIGNDGFMIGGLNVVQPNVSLPLFLILVMQDRIVRVQVVLLSLQNLLLTLSLSQVQIES